MTGDRRSVLKSNLWRSVKRHADAALALASEILIRLIERRSNDDGDLANQDAPRQNKRRAAQRGSAEHQADHHDVPKRPIVVQPGVEQILVVTAAASLSHRRIVATPPLKWTRCADHALRRAERTTRKVDLDLGLRGRIGGHDIDRTSDGRPSIQGRARAAHDLNTARVVDGEGNDPSVISRVGLRYAIDKEQRVGELVADTWHAAEEHRLKDAELGRDERPRHVLDSFGQPLIAASVDRLSIDDRRGSPGDIANTLWRL